MEKTGERQNFRVIDFVIFIGLFLVSAIVGAVFRYRDRNRQSLENYYFGGRKVNSIPVAISIAVSVISALTVIGVPAEVYLYGEVYGWFAISLSCPIVIGVVYVIPLFHRLRVTSTYEICYLSIAIFLPSLALSAVTSLDLTWTIGLTSMTCTLYTTLGGMKAVIWTDVLQSVIMLSGMAAMFTRTVIVVGGFDEVNSAIERGGRNNMLTFDIDPTVRSSALTILFGGAVNLCHGIVCNQIYVQRWMSCKTTNSARMALILSAIPLALYYFLAIGNGLAMYAYYEGCDPLLSGQITKSDQLGPRLAVDIFYDVPGLAGLFVSAAFCGTLSTVSSGLNALSALGLMDLTMKCFPNLISKKQIMISKAYTVAFGAVVMLLAYAVSLTDSNAVEIGNMFLGFFAGPIVGIYLMGMAMPWINYKGVAVGYVCGFGFVTWIGLSSFLSTYVNESSKILPLSTDNCTYLDDVNATTPINTDFTSSTATTSIGDANQSEVPRTLERTLFAISTYLYGVIGMILCVVSAHIASIFFGFSKPSEADPRLFVPLIDNKCFPRRVRKFFRFGVPEITDENLSTISCDKNEEGIPNSEAAISQL